MNALSKLMFAPNQVKVDIVRTQKGHTSVHVSEVLLVMEYRSASRWETKSEQVVQVRICLAESRLEQENTALQTPLPPNYNLLLLWTI